MNCKADSCDMFVDVFFGGSYRLSMGICHSPDVSMFDVWNGISCKLSLTNVKAVCSRPDHAGFHSGFTWETVAVTCAFSPDVSWFSPTITSPTVVEVNFS